MRLHEWQALHKPAKDMIRTCSTVDVVDGECSMSIGMCPTMWTVSDDILCEPTRESFDRSTLLNVHINPVTDQLRNRSPDLTRAAVCQNLRKNGFYNNPPLSPLEYWRSLQSSMFVASPEGNGIDCHRTYEALWAGCIPIVQDCSRVHIEAVYGNVPILWTKDYSEITDSYLRDALHSMLQKEYCFDRLLVSKLSGQERQMHAWRSQIWKDVTKNGKEYDSTSWGVHSHHFKKRMENYYKSEQYQNKKKILKEAGK